MRLLGYTWDDHGVFNNGILVLVKPEELPQETWESLANGLVNILNMLRKEYSE